MLLQDKLRVFGGLNACHMRRSLILPTGYILIACLVLATSVSGFLGTTHDLARVGQSTLVICGQDGASVITLDRKGNPAQPASTGCGHCADCSLISAFDVPVMAAIASQTPQARSGARTAIDIILISAAPRYLPRGPPYTFGS